MINGATCNATLQSGCDQVPGTVKVGAGPLGIGVDPTTNSIYVANTGAEGGAYSGLGHTVSLIDGATCNGTDQSGVRGHRADGHRRGCAVRHCRRPEHEQDLRREQQRRRFLSQSLGDQWRLLRYRWDVGL